MYLPFLATCFHSLTLKLIISSSFLIALPVVAQTFPIPRTGNEPLPNIDRFPQPLPTPSPLPPEDTLPIIPTPPTPTPLPEDSPIQIPVRKIDVVGSTILSQDEITRITKSFEGRSVTLKELRDIADKITQFYINRGYITSRAVLADQTISDGVVKILVIEGSLEKIEVKGTRRLNKSYIRSRIRLGVERPLKPGEIEEQLRLLKLDPALKDITEAILKPGTKLGQSILSITVEEADTISGFVGVDNYSPPAVGSERLGGVISYRNPIGVGDELSASYYRSTAGGFNSFDFNYRVPINPMNGTLQFRYAPSDSKIIRSDFSDRFDITSDRELYEISYRQPLVRTLREEFALSLGFSVQDGQSFLDGVPTPFGDGPDDQGNSKTRVLKFGQDYIKRDRQGAWGVRSQFSLGIDVFDATVNTSSTPDGLFFSWLGQVQRVQQLNRDNLLIAQAELQLSPNSLLSSQQFLIGGGQSLRGYQQNARAGDNGFRLSVENRTTLNRNEFGNPNVQIAPFVDMGAVWNQSENPNDITGENFLASVGLGLILEPIPNFLMRIDYAVPFVKSSTRGENAQDRGLSFSVGYGF
ncbi:MAG: ShlB/FhaC/HecB family hemolysin secretion/activation protein [Scytonema sp. PMC 1069.18]|nr:ShlB/FhaC/HecB family hemolysin secretion/activation protein [Scytonema sp. PMC 1069.18]MEC4882754.1 ShlB/FhaC/HecB family hemolysin secretion/activation protein [Scytonema sp. PMC 1070.18]